MASDDFQRLGLRTQECRLGVIRRAAARRTKVLATRQLATPTSQAELQLSKVASAVYRLMDPRNRIDRHQRVFLGRITPRTLSWAGRTSFAIVGDGQPSQTPDAAPVPTESPFDSIDTPFIDSDAPVASLPTGVDLASPITLNLDAEDLLDRGVSRQRWKRLLSPVVLISAAVSLALFTATLSFLTGRDANETLVASDQPLIESQPAETLPKTELPEPYESELADATNQQSKQAPNVKDPASIASVDLNSGSISGLGEAPTSAMPSTTKLPEPEFLTDPFAGTPASFPSPTTMTEEEEIEASPAISEIVAQSPLVPELTPTEPNTAEPSTSELPNTSAEMAVVDPVASALTPEIALDNTAPVAPNQQQADELRASLTELVPLLQQPIESANVGEAIAQLDTIETKLAENSPDFWVARLMAAELLWLRKGRGEVANRLKPIAADDESMRGLLATTFSRRPNLTATQLDHLHLFDQGLRLYDEMLLSQEFTLAKQVSQAVKSSVEFLADDENQTSLAQFDVAYDNMMRSFETAQQTLESVDDNVSSSQAGITGRYLCLMCRDWQAGLPWLAKGSDARLATLAKQELTISDETTVDEQIELSNRWLVAAERVEGRAVDSIRQHAMGLMLQAQASATGLRQLELERTIEEVSATLPEYLVDRDAVTQQVTDKTPSQPANSQPAMSSSANLTGRMRIDGTDVGIRLKYQPPTAITNEMIEQVRQQLGREFAEVTLELVGEFELSEAATIRMRQSNNDNLRRKITMDGQVLIMEEASPVIEVALGAGRHLIEWTVSGRNFDRVFLDVRNAETQLPIETDGAYQRSNDDAKDRVSVDMVLDKR